MSAPRRRSPSAEATSKRRKLDGSDDAIEYFAEGLFSAAPKFAEEYRASRPFKHVRAPTLFQDSLLESVKDECINELCFTEKETDIYKVFQTGDLASLNYIDAAQRARLPSLVKLRDALYSESFRAFIRAVTGCGPLSGTKQDMSVNSYRKGCHLLNHDDVIDTRRVSYILYMPQSGKAGGQHEWDDTWGGALELYDVQEGKGEPNQPLPSPYKIIPPSWNQFIFFEVQPGRSFHSVQEVLVGDESDPRQRLSISGWFHKPQKGEKEYIEEKAPIALSSLQQLSTSSSLSFRDYIDSEDDLPQLSETDASFLSKYMNPTYLTSQSVEQIAERFALDSHITLADFLTGQLARQLQECLHAEDQESGYTSPSNKGIPAHDSGLNSGWSVQGPPHKSRYCIPSTQVSAARATSNHALSDLRDNLFASAAFRAWLAWATSLIPHRYIVQARRFRPGLDYTLATSESEESRLDVCLGLTSQMSADGTGDWETGALGGWECYMAPHEGEDDPAVYSSGQPSKRKEGEENDEGVGSDIDTEDDSTLLTVPPAFNQLVIVLRDEGVLRFVKYVSAAVRGSRWDVVGEYEVGKIEHDVDS